MELIVADFLMEEITGFVIIFEHLDYEARRIHKRYVTELKGLVNKYDW